MNKNALLKMGACACTGALIGFGIDMVVKKRKQKEVKKVVKENANKNSDMVDSAVKTGCVLCACYAAIKVTYCIVNYISELDTKATVSNMLSIINGAKLGLIEKDVVERMLLENVPSLDETSKTLVKDYALSVFPDLVGGVDYE